MQGPKGDEWISRVDAPQFGITAYWTRVGKEPRELRRDLVAGGWSCFFTEHRDNWWCKTRCVHPSGREVHYEGVMGRQRPTMIITAKGNYQYWYVHGNHVRKSRTFMPPSDVSGVDAMLCYEYKPVDGDDRLEKAHLVRVELSDGRVRHYAGPPGWERRTKTVFKCGTAQYYVGARGLERVERQDNANGDVFHYVGERGCERLWRINNEDGLINLFQGPRCRERLHATINMHERDDRKGTCTLVVYRGERGSELRKRRLKSATGAFEVLQCGPENVTEKCLRMLRGDGVLMTRQTVNDPWLEHDESATAAPAAKRQRVKEKAAALWSELEALAEGDAVKEQALVAMGPHFKELTEAVDKCVA
jgi:hypothetical protein